MVGDVKEEGCNKLAQFTLCVVRLSTITRSFTKSKTHRQRESTLVSIDPPPNPSSFRLPTKKDSALAIQPTTCPVPRFACGGLTPPPTGKSIFIRMRFAQKRKRG